MIRALSTCLSGVVFCLLCAAAPVRAQLAATPGDYHARMDGDGDGRVSLTEYQQQLGYAFGQLDRNRDGMLDLDELPAGARRAIGLQAHRATLARRFALQDVDGDGFLDVRELTAPPR